MTRTKAPATPVKPQEAPPADVAIGPVSQALGVLTVAHTEIRPGPWQPRTVFDEGKLQELAESIKARGILVPLRVARATDGQGGYWLISGERRWRAAALAGLDTLPCLLAVLPQSPDGSSNQAQLDALLENMHRDDLRPGEEAHGLKALADFGLTQREIAEATGKSQAWVADRLGLLKLPDKAVEALDHGVITVEDARSLKKLADTPELVELCLVGDNKGLTKALGRDIYAWGGVGDRAEKAAAVQAGKRKAEQVRAKLQSEGKTLIGRKQADQLPWLSSEQYGEGARHKELGLTCLGYEVLDDGEVRMYCTDPKALGAGRPKESEADRRQREERTHNRLVERARDEAVRLWAAGPTVLKGDYPDDLLTFFRVTISLCATHTTRWSQVATWLGIEGKNQGERAAAFWRTLGAVPSDKQTWERPSGLENALLHLATPRLVQLWMLQELAGQVSSYSIVPTAYAKWLEDIGFKTPRPGSIPGKKLVEVVGDDVGDAAAVADRHCRRCLCDQAKPCSADDRLVPDQQFPDEGDICTDCVAELADQEKLLSEARQTVTAPAAVG